MTQSPPEAAQAMAAALSDIAADLYTVDSGTDMLFVQRQADAGNATAAAVVASLATAWEQYPLAKAAVDDLQAAVAGHDIKAVDGMLGPAAITLPDIITVGVMGRPRANLALSFDANVVLWSTYDRIDINFNSAPDRAIVSNGQNTFTGLNNKAAADRAGGDAEAWAGTQARDASYLSAAGTIAGTAGSMLKTYGSFNFPGAGRAAYG